ncbi:uncharacterized protein LOC132741237 [Ruditapes philippinarum]|uniref:uncharacterized protein LOC132741237 n=1 Tax=Ruditapes philippinarum TaxID=129788 RepID=UPI00295B213D|nr:uncharacterized protein LOC132741237 [Ruditapes philippinarum]
MVKFSILICFVCIFYQYSNATSINTKAKSKRFFMDWMATASKFFMSPMTIPMSMFFKSECVRCKCNTECNGEKFAETIFGVKPDDRSVCGGDYWDSIHCSNGQSKTNATIQPTVANVAVATAQIPLGPGCDKLCAITAVAKSKPQTNPNASVCPKGVLTSNDALPMNCCKLNASNTWQKGAKVFPNCQAIPHYTPVGAFINNIYIPGSAGVFTGCLTNGESGFQMIYQDCGVNPGLLHVTKQNTANNDPDLFYII